MKRLILISAVVLVAAVVAAQAPFDEDDEQELTISLQEVPEQVLQAAREAVEGIEFTEAEVEAVLVYELKGTVNGREIEVEVTAEGQVIEIDDEEDEDDRIDDAKR